MAALAAATLGRGEKAWSRRRAALVAATGLAAAAALIGPYALTLSRRAELGADLERHLAVWSELDEPVGDDLARLADADDPEAIAAELAAKSGAAPLAAWRVLQAVQRGPVFLRSRLPPDTVEPLGLAPVASAAEMLRMASRFDACAVLDAAQHVQFEDEPSSLENAS